MSKIIGSHSVIHTTNPSSDRAFFRDVLKFSNVDAGDGWLIFSLPPSEVAFHPASSSGLQEFYLLCDNVEAFVKEMKQKGIVLPYFSTSSIEKKNHQQVNLLND